MTLAANTDIATGATVSTSTHRYAMSHADAAAWADFWLGRGAHLLPLRMDGSKKPMNPGWPDARAMTRGDIINWLMAGGGIGINLGKSAWVVFDADNAKATELFKAVGMVQTVITANSQVATSPKFGGAQFLFHAPAGFDPDLLHSRGFELPGGAKGDVLGGRRYIVAAPTRLDEAGGLGYLSHPDGPLVTGGDLERIGAWVADPNTPGDFGPLQPLVGLLGPRKPHERVEDEAGEWRTPRQLEIDEIGLDQVLDCDAGLLFSISGTDSCGCDVREYRHQTSKDGRGFTAHDGCAHGWFVRTWSGSMHAAFNLPESTDRLRFAALIRGFAAGSAQEMDLGRRWGVNFAGLIGFADQLDGVADDFDDLSESVEFPTTARVPVTDVRGVYLTEVPAGRAHWARVAEDCRRTAVVVRGGQLATRVQQTGGETFTGARVIGGVEPIDVEVVEDTAAGGGAEAAVPTDDDEVFDGEIVDDTDGAVEARKVLRELRPKMVQIEKQMATKTPGLQRIAACAESNGVFMHGLTGALLPRIVASVPPNVLLPPRNGDLSSKVKGQGINQFGVQIAPSSAGKTETDLAAEAAIPLQDGVAEIGTGTSESWSKALRGVKDGEAYIKTTSLVAQVDEIVDFNSELTRTGTKMKGWLASTWMNGGGGQSTSDEKNSAHLPRHGSRIGVSLSAQPGRMDVLVALADQGASHRFAKTMAGIVRAAAQGPLYGVPVPPVMADQSKFPWSHTGHVGEPPILCQQPAAALAAAAASGVPPIGNGAGRKDADGNAKPGVVGYDNAAPIWFELPAIAKTEVAEALEVGGERAEDWGLAFDQDQEGLITGHRVAMKLHVAAAFAVLDGTLKISVEMWEAAELFQQGSDLTYAACISYMVLSGEADAWRTGQLKGVTNAAARAADATMTSSGTQSSMRAIIRLLKKQPAGTSMPGYIKGKMSKGQKNHAAQASAAMVQAGMLRINLDGSWTLTGQLAIAA